MHKYLSYLLLIFIPFLVGLNRPFSNQKITNAEKINSDNFQNLYKVNDQLYRSEQPTKLGMKELEQLGVKTILNLRNLRSDKNEARGTALIMKHIPINTWKFCYTDIINALKEIEKSEKPVLVHCLHGSDRTGAVVAAYRMAYQNWTKEEAIAEFTNKQFGYHQGWFPEILTVLETLDIEKLRADVN